MVAPFPSHLEENSFSSDHPIFARRGIQLFPVPLSLLPRVLEGPNRTSSLSVFQFHMQQPARVQRLVVVFLRSFAAVLVLEREQQVLLGGDAGAL